MSRPLLLVTVVSDTMCPWCFVGKRNLERAVRSLNANGVRADVRVRWSPFLLNERLPVAGLSMAEYFEEVYGDATIYERNFPHLQRAGAAAGIAFKATPTRRLRPTVRSHLLVELAQRLDDEELATTDAGASANGAKHEAPDYIPTVGAAETTFWSGPREGRVMEHLFKHYFEQGGDTYDEAPLLEAARAAGIDEARARAHINDENAAAAIVKTARAWSRGSAGTGKGIGGVPYFIIRAAAPGGGETSRRITLSGGQPPARFEAAFAEILAQLPKPTVAAAAGETPASSADGAVCDVDGRCQ